MKDYKNLNRNEVVICYKGNKVVFVLQAESMHRHCPVWSECHYEYIGMYEESIGYNFPVDGILTRKHMGTLKTTVYDKPYSPGVRGKISPIIIHQSFIPAKGISLKVIDSRCICPHCGGMLKF